MTENKDKDIVYKSYIAHVNPEKKQIQSLESHLNNVVQLIDANCPLDCIRNLTHLAGMLHDCGKCAPEFQEYMLAVLEHGDQAARRQVDHSTAGGRILIQAVEENLASKIISTAVYSHHGLQDCVNLTEGHTLEEKRRKKEIDLDQISSGFFHIYDRAVMKSYFTLAAEEVQQIKTLIIQIIGKDRESLYGVRNFYLGMYERVILSLLIDSDWGDTASFSKEEEFPKRKVRGEIKQIWENAAACYERYLTKLNGDEKESPLNQCRKQISNACRAAAETKDNLYRFTVPTGAGKTLSSLRFALHHAMKYEKQHIIYIAPFHSILEQNAEVIRSVVGNEEMVLEHHCNMMIENPDQEERYRKLTEDWDIPIVVTTAVQILNTLFSSKKKDVRRMHSLCNSVIIFDEVQAIPIHCLELFHLAVNFLSAFCNTTVVLCSATQPSLAKIPKNRVFESGELAGEAQYYTDQFRRSEIVDKSDVVSGGMGIEELKEFIVNLFPRQKSILVIVNTKGCAKALYQALLSYYEETSLIYHLSTNMCAANRKVNLQLIKETLQKKLPIICISTQLVEAGVDFSFGCVVRSMAGLDNLIQAAGRCNRNKESTMGVVYIVKMSREAENLSGLPEIREAQDAMEEVLFQYKRDPASLDQSLDSVLSLKLYYNKFYASNIKNKTNYPISGYGGEANIVDLLSDNSLGCRQYERIHGRKCKVPLNQAFKTAGDAFLVIPEDEKVEIIVEYDEEAKRLLSELSNPYLGIREQKLHLRKLQIYTVGISERLRRQLGNAIYTVCSGSVLALSENYYDPMLGVTETPKLDTMIF